MTTLNEVKKYAKSVGATVEDDKIGNTHECRIEAPKGHIWSEGDVHEMVDDAYRPWKPDYADLLARMKYGVSVCPNPECEWCNPSEDEQ